MLELPGLETMFQGSLHNHVSPTAIHAMNRELGKWLGPGLFDPCMINCHLAVHLTRALSDEANHRLQTQWTDSSGMLELPTHTDLTVESDKLQNGTLFQSTTLSWPWLLR